MVWVPDEEIGGPEGMKRFVTSDVFRQLNIGVMLDEGLAHEGETLVVYVGERTPMWVRVEAKGPSGHGSKLLDKTAVERMSRAMERIMAQRDHSVQRLHGSDTPSSTATPRDLGDVTSWNITALQAGVSSDGGKTFAPNVIPGSAFCVVDIRATAADFHQVLQELTQISRDCSVQISFIGHHFDPKEGPSPYSHVPHGSEASSVATPASGAWWYSLLHGSIAKWGCSVEARIFPGATDSRYVRRMDVPAFGFSPMPNTPSLLHDHNEYLERKVFLKGVEMYMDVISTLASAPSEGRSML